jgi:ATP-dependent Clp protease adaptor protein ClpS
MSTENPYQSPRAALGNEASSNPAGAGFLRLAGAVLVAFGILFAWLLSRGAMRLLSGPPADPGISAFSALLTPIMIFCLYVGARLLFLRPTARGSLMGPIGWYALTAFVGVASVALTISNLRDPHGSWGSAFAILAFGGLFCAGCIWAARGRSPGYVDAPTDAEDDVDVSTDAPAWVELQNDDRTPMEFVVNTLCDVFSMPRREAITLMLRVHRGGNARVPCASLEEARERAGQIMKSARDAGHPLACEAAQRVPE